MENKDNWSKSMHFAFRIIGIVIAILLTFFVGITVLGIYWPDIQEYRYRLEAERFTKEIEETKNRIAELEKADTFGGKTPEETFDMFLDSLRKNDAELAAKYYDVVVQKEALESFKSELLENGNLEMSLNYFTEVRRGEKRCNENIDGCVFEYSYVVNKDNKIKDEIGNEILILNGERRDKFFDFKLNKTQGIWKATQPF